MAVLSRLIGEWELVISIQGQPLSRGRTTFEWLEAGQFVVQHADAAATNEAPQGWAESSPFPVTAVIGIDDTSGALAMLYADARGVFRIYQMRLEGDVWRIWRDAPGFLQRFIGTFDSGGRAIAGRWEASEDGKEWKVDFELTYTRIETT